MGHHNKTPHLNTINNCLPEDKHHPPGSQKTEKEICKPKQSNFKVESIPSWQLFVHAPTGQASHNDATSCAAKEREKNPTQCSSK
jgi:hypothetical protein